MPAKVDMGVLLCAAHQYRNFNDSVRRTKMRSFQGELFQRITVRTFVMKTAVSRSGLPEGELDFTAALLRERFIREQREAIRELSTPVLPVRERLLILPIIGVIDPQRARQLTEQLLRGIRANRARVVVIDKVTPLTTASMMEAQPNKAHYATGVH